MARCQCLSSPRVFSRRRVRRLAASLTRSSARRNRSRSKVTTTLDIYCQIVPETQAQANRKVDRFLDKAGTTQLTAEKAGTGLSENNWKRNGSNRVQ